MSDDPGHDDAGEGTAGWEPTDAPTTGSTPQVREPVPHSRLVGFMAEPMTRSVPLRRSTVLMLVAFLGFGTLCYLYPPNAGSASSGATSNGGIPGVFVPASTTPTTTTSTTTTTRPVGPTTTTTTTRPTTTTTTTTTTVPLGSTTTTTAPSGASTTTTAPTTTTSAAAP